jgi:hypothetical protein
MNIVNGRKSQARDASSASLTGSDGRGVRRLSTRQAYLHHQSSKQSVRLPNPRYLVSMLDGASAACRPVHRGKSADGHVSMDTEACQEWDDLLWPRAGWRASSTASPDVESGSRTSGSELPGGPGQTCRKRERRFERPRPQEVCSSEEQSGKALSARGRAIRSRACIEFCGAFPRLVEGVNQV